MNLKYKGRMINFIYKLYKHIIKPPCPESTLLTGKSPRGSTLIPETLRKPTKPLSPPSAGILNSCGTGCTPHRI